MEQERELAEPETHAPKKRKTAEKKTVVTVKIGEKAENLFKNEGLPSDLWSWRKYGQKPIKGSPYPRGYYRCSTCKGCSAKKQIERCRTDASLLIITYSNNHNHPDPDDDSQSLTLNSQNHRRNEQNSYKPIISPALKSAESAESDADRLRGSHTESCLLDDRCLAGETETDRFLLVEEEPVRSDPTTSFSAVGSEMENDFFDELEELLPMSSDFRFREDRAKRRRFR